MPIYKRESLESLRQKVDIIEVLKPYVELKPAGATYKALCPFHDEKSPSFTVQRGTNHYHCFGCSAHGDSISFLMEHQRMTFVEAVEFLAQKFNIHLDVEESSHSEPTTNKKALHEALDQACRFYHFYLLHTDEGHHALQYLYSRGIDIEFIKQFHIGLAPKAPNIFLQVMHEKKIPNEILVQAGLLKVKEGGGHRDFFYDRITIPIHHPSGGVIGFTARKYKEDTFGGKYVNSTETPLFKKSHVLFGLNYCRKRIAKEKRTIIVEGQIDALRLIKEGFDMTVASQGTAFGEGHIQILLRLGVEMVYLCFDSDKAGTEAAIKVGHLFQKTGVGVLVVTMPQGSDPDSFLRSQGVDPFTQLLRDAKDYLTFLVDALSKDIDISTPAGKNTLVKHVTSQIRSWNSEVMVYESLKKLAQLTHLPEEVIGMTSLQPRNILIKHSDTVGALKGQTDPLETYIPLEGDLIRWIILAKREAQRYITWTEENIHTDDFKHPRCRKIYEAIKQNIDPQLGVILIDVAATLEEQEQGLLNELMNKKVDRGNVDTHFETTLQQIMTRNWLEKREDLRKKIDLCSTDEEMMTCLKEFDRLKNQPPQVKITCNT
jgi:DNA primase